ncbi:hypothetical protein IWW40_000035 [Coemansia sp. RSA 1250]|nr:hypothetical protein IWW40_000035 [Coemansia sp. RSA 1250]
MRIDWASHVALVLYSNFGLVLGDSLLAIRGLDPALAEKYKPVNGKFTCLDGSKELAFSRVNDDYCDCADGSDEPGTSACENGTFYCANKGHIPGKLRAWQVNDGVCDYDVCCDGSDEWDSEATCPDKCSEIGKAHRQIEAEQQQKQQAGAKRLHELVDQAKQLREAKTAELAEEQIKLEQLEKQLAEAEARKNDLEQQQRDYEANSNAGKLQALSDQHLPDFIRYRKLLSAELHILRAHRDTLILMLKAVRSDHNPEFNDEAVLSAISGYSEFIDAYPYLEAAALEYADEDTAAREERQLQMDRDNEEQDDVSLSACANAVEIALNERQTLNDDISMLYGLMDGMRSGYNKNYHDLAVKGAVSGLDEFDRTRERDLVEVKDQKQQVDELKKTFDEVKPQVSELAELASDDSSGDLDTQVSEARSTFWDKQSEKTQANSKVSNLQELLKDKDLGPEDVFLPVYKECFSLDAGEYTYEVCLLDRATQIENKNSARQNLGTFAGFGDGNDYSKLKFTHGTKCWNGPERSMTVKFECSSEIKLVSVKEPEKCEYEAHMTGPFACGLSQQHVEDPETSGLEAADLSAEAEAEAEAVKDHPHDEL